jgi:hypothetical protein
MSLSCCVSSHKKWHILKRDLVSKISSLIQSLSRKCQPSFTCNVQKEVKNGNSKAGNLCGQWLTILSCFYAKLCCHHELHISWQLESLNPLLFRGLHSEVHTSWRTFQGLRKIAVRILWNTSPSRIEYCSEDLLKEQKEVVTSNPWDYKHRTVPRIEICS